MFAVKARQVIPVPDDADLEALVFAEPFAVCLHALSRIKQDIRGKKILVTGSGPIGCLIVMLARYRGAATVVATDIAAEALNYARIAGADAIVLSSAPDALVKLAGSTEDFDIAFECSGHPSGLADAIGSLRSRGELVQVRMLGSDITAPRGAIVVKEIDYKGTFRFDVEFSDAVALLVAGAIDVRALVSHQMNISDYQSAFDMAADRLRAMKVQLLF